MLLSAWSRLVIVAIFFASGATLVAQEEFRLRRLNGVIKLDGHSDDPAWQAIAPVPLTMRQPTFDGTPTERTEIRLAYDDGFLYASGRFYDSNPCGVRVNSLYRDRNEGDDTFDLIVDTFNGNENALWFWTNPAGVRGDLAISNDGSASNESWNTLHAFVQYNSAVDLIATNARFRYNLREGSDLWVVYNEDLNAERERNELILPRTNDRTVLLKYTHTFARM